MAGSHDRPHWRDEPDPHTSTGPDGEQVSGLPHVGDGPSVGRPDSGEDKCHECSNASR
jgi:hypothetical protein